MYLTGLYQFLFFGLNSTIPVMPTHMFNVHSKCHVTRCIERYLSYFNHNKKARTDARALYR